MKIFRSDQIKEIDEYTIRYEPIASSDLMERAARELFIWITERFGRSEKIFVFTGPGNNGGDGLALTRMLQSDRYDVNIYYVDFTDKRTADWEINRKRLETETNLRLNSITSIDQFPVIAPYDIIIDAIFGSGLARPVEGFPGEVIKQINTLDAKTISIDIPSGLFGENNGTNISDSIVKADFTLSFQFPKLSFMFADNAPYVGQLEILPIGLHKTSISNTATPYSLVERRDVNPLLKQRNKFDHKGNFGHGLLISGSKGKMGAAVLGAGAALRSGIGLITCHIPVCGNVIIQSTLPEAMVILDKSEDFVSEVGSTKSFNAVGIGPGLGTEVHSRQAVRKLISECTKPLVIDADALNILALNKTWLDLLPAGTLLTPHPKEFERLAGETNNGYNRFEKQINFSRKHNCIVILKGANTSITIPDGRVFFNSTGNPGMATAGSGDVLTGIILSLLAQGYRPENASVLGTFLHGLAGDFAAEASGYESVVATDIINNLGKAFMKIRENEL